MKSEYNPRNSDFTFKSLIRNQPEHICIQRRICGPGIARRSGLGGKTRHVKVQYLCIQGAIQRQDLHITNILSIDHPADLLTEFCAVSSTLDTSILSGMCSQGRASGRDTDRGRPSE